MNSVMTGNVGKVEVVTTQNTGLDSDYWAEQCLKRIVSVGNQSAGPIRDQALAFEEDIRKVVRHYMAEAVRSERTTIYNLLQKGGAADVAEHIRRM